MNDSPTLQELRALLVKNDGGCSASSKQQVAGRNSWHLALVVSVTCFLTIDINNVVAQQPLRDAHYPLIPTVSTTYLL